MAKDIRDIERQLDEERRAADSVNQRLDNALTKAQGLKQSRDEQIRKLQDLEKALTYKGSEVGKLDRIFTALGALSTGSASKATADWISSLPENQQATFDTVRKQTGVFIKEYVDGVQKDFQTAFTGKQQRSKARESYADMFGPAGILMDMTLDPTMFAGGQIKTGTQAIAGAASNIVRALERELPAVQKVTDTWSRMWNIFHDVEKNPQFAGQLTALKDAFRVAAHTGNYKGLRAFGTYIKDAGDVALPGLKNYAFAPELRELFQRAFITNKQGPSSALGRTWMDLQSGYKQYVTGAFPTFHLRNLFDGIIKNAGVEGVGARDYFNALKNFNSPLYKELGISGQVGQIGGAGRWGSTPWEWFKNAPSAVSNIVETLSRAPLFEKERRLGAWAGKAAEKTEKVHYQYNSAYDTPFMRFMDPLDIWRKFTVGQAGYWPGALAANIPKFDLYGKAYEATKPGPWKDQPWKKPSYLDGMYMLGGYGGFGTSAEDALRLFTGNPKAATSHLNPFIKAALEASADYSFFRERSISGDKGAGQYKHANSFLQSLVGYNAGAGTVDPWARWGTEQIGQRFLSTYLNAVDPKRPGTNLWWPIKDYSLTGAQNTNLYQMENPIAGKPGFLKNLIRNWSIGSVEAASFYPEGGFGGGSGPNVPVDPVLARSAKARKLWADATGLPADEYGKSIVLQGAASDSKMILDAGTNLGKELAKQLLIQGPDIGKNFADSMVVQLKTKSAETDAWVKAGAISDKDRNALLEAMKNAAMWTSPRAAGGEAYYSGSDLMKYRRTLGTTPGEQAFNRSQEEYIQFLSKTSDIRQSGTGRSRSSIQRALSSEIAGVRQIARMSSWSDPDAIEARIAELREKADREIEEVDRKVQSALAATMQEIADAEIDGIQKIERQRAAAVAKFESSEEALLLKRENKTEEIEKRIDAINATYSRKKQERIAQEAKATADLLADSLKDQTSAAIESLKIIYERGGMTIPDYYAKQSAAVTDQFRRSGVSAIKSFSANLAAPHPFLTNMLDELSNQLMQPGMSLGDTVEKMTEVYDVMKGSLDQGDIVKLSEAAKGFANLLNGLKQAGEQIKLDMQADTLKFNAGIAELSKYSKQTLLDAYTQSGAPTLGIGSFGAGGGVTWSRKHSPFAPAGFNTTEEIQKMRLEAFDEDTSKFISAKASELPGGLDIRSRRVGESASDYLASTESQLQDRKAKLQESALSGLYNEEEIAKLDQGIRSADSLLDAMAARHVARNAMIVQNEKQAKNERLQVASDMASMLSQTAQMIYEQSGKQSAAAFYAMKAMALAEAAIKGTQAIINSFEAGTKINPMVGQAFAAVAATFVGVQMGIIASQMVQGPQRKAKGGLIEGGSGQKDDVPIMAMGGEFMMRQSAVNKYGVNFMEALNRGLIPTMNISIPAIPTADPGRSHYAEGGLITTPEASEGGGNAVGDISLVNIVDPRMIDAYMASQSGRRMIVNVIGSQAYEVRRSLGL